MVHTHSVSLMCYPQGPWAPGQLQMGNDEAGLTTQHNSDWQQQQQMMGHGSMMGGSQGQWMGMVRDSDAKAVVNPASAWAHLRQGDLPSQFPPLPSVDTCTPQTPTASLSRFGLNPGLRMIYAGAD